MGKRISRAEQDRLDQEEEARLELHDKRANCSHWDSRPTEWHWETGLVRELFCRDCGETKYFEEQ